MALFLLLTMVCGLMPVAFAEVPHLINYQAKLTDTEANPLEGAYDLTFRIYDAETAGNLLWEETQAGVVIQKGVFSILLGSVTALDLAFDKQYWLVVKVGEDSEMAPRQRIASSGYSYMAQDVLSVPKGVIVMWSGRIQDIPQGWALCDGNNGTPNLTDRFVIHADADNGGTNNVGVTGGEQTHILTTDELPAHTHGSTGGHIHDIQYLLGGVSRNREAQSQLSKRADNPASAWNSWESLSYRMISAGAHTHTSVGSGDAHENRPKFYALAYIMKI